MASERRTVARVSVGFRFLRRGATASFAGVALLGVVLASAGAAGWPVVFGSPGSVITSVKIDASGDVWVAGRIADDGETPALWVARLDPGGTMRWQQRPGSAGYQLAPLLGSRPDGAWLAAEVLRPQVPVASGGSLPASAARVWLLDRNGKEVRAIELDRGRVNQPRAMLTLADGGVLIAGQTAHGDDQTSKGWLVRLDADGRVRWERTLSGVWWLSALAASPERNLVVAGTAPGGGERGRPWFAVVTDDGRIERERTLDVPGVDLQALLVLSNDYWLAGQQVSPPSPQSADDLGPVRRAWLVVVPRAGGAVREVPLESMLDAHALIAGGPDRIVVGGEGMPGLPRPGGPAWPWVTVVNAAGDELARGPAEGSGPGELRALAWLGGRALAGGSQDAGGAWVGNAMPPIMRPVK